MQLHGPQGPVEDSEECTRKASGLRRAVRGLVVERRRRRIMSKCVFVPKWIVEFIVTRI